MKTKIFLLTILFLLPVFGSGEQTSVQQKDDPTVIICTGKYSKRYHAYMCKGMKACKGDVKKVKLSEARKKGLTPCGYCYK